VKYQKEEESTKDMKVTREQKNQKKKEIITFILRRDFSSADNPSFPDDCLVVLRSTTAIERLSYLTSS